MKQKVLLMLFTLGVSFSAMARPDKEVLICESDRASIIQIELDSRGYVKNSGYTKAVRAVIWHLFSSTNDMTCVGSIKFDSYDVQCAGYYWPNELTELKVKNNGSNIFVEWTTSESYGKTKIKTPCILKEITE